MVRYTFLAQHKNGGIINCYCKLYGTEAIKKQGIYTVDETTACNEPVNTSAGRVKSMFYKQNCFS